MYRRVENAGSCFVVSLGINDHRDLIRNCSRGRSRTRAHSSNYRGLGRRGGPIIVGQIDGGDVVNAGSPLIFASRVEPNEVLLSVASDLGRGPAGDEVAGDVSPITSAVFLQTHKKQPETNRIYKFS